MNSRELSHRLQSRSKLAAGFTDRTAAESAAEAIRTRLHDDASTVVIVAPGERDSDAFDRKVGARSGVVRDQLLVSHVVLGIGGALLGAIAMMVVLALVMEAPLDDPWLYPMIGAFFGAIAGLLLAGVWSLKPREGYLASRIADHARDGAWHVVVKAETSGDADRAEEIAGDRSRSVLKS